MVFFFPWIIFTFVVASIGASRKVGGVSAFFISLFFSPIIGILVVLSSEKLSTIKFQKDLLEQTKKDTSVADIENLHNLWKKGIITQAEFIDKKKKILTQ